MPAQLMLPYFERLQTKFPPPKTKSMLCMVRIQNGFVRKHVMFQTYLSPLDRNVQNVIFPGVTACFVFVTPTQTLKFKNKLTSLWWDFYLEYMSKSSNTLTTAYFKEKQHILAVYVYCMWLVFRSPDGSLMSWWHHKLLLTSALSGLLGLESIYRDIVTICWCTLSTLHSLFLDSSIYKELWGDLGWL